MISLVLFSPPTRTYHKFARSSPLFCTINNTMVWHVCRSYITRGMSMSVRCASGEVCAFHFYVCDFGSRLAYLLSTSRFIFYHVVLFAHTGSRKLFGGYRITPKFCRASKTLPRADPRSHGPTICMFNHECTQRQGEVVGACMDG